jgi:hypothetical protein
MDVDDSLDRRLHDELGPELNRAVGDAAPPFPRYRSMPTQRRFRLRLVGLVGVPLAVSVRTVAALAAATLAVGGGTAVAVSSHPGAGTGSTQGPLATVQLSAASSTSSSANSSNSAHPSNHGGVVTSAVASCKAARPSPHASPKPSPGSRGIGQCVSKVASGGHSSTDASEPAEPTDSAEPTKPAHPTPHPHPTPPPHS